MELTERFINYTTFDTQSAEDSTSVPSTPKQLDFARYLKDELEREGFADVEMDDKGYIYATLKANTKKEVPTIGFISHYDTSPDASGKDVKARIVSNYDGTDIELSPGIVSTTEKFPELLLHKGRRPHRYGRDYSFGSRRQGRYCRNCTGDVLPARP